MLKLILVGSLLFAATGANAGCNEEILSIVDWSASHPEL
ncbi:hypothetical protein ACVJMZ_000389 [Sinorhizobium medicae]